jgi:hypothetical protein
VKLFSEIKRLFQYEDIRISERMHTVEASFIIPVQKLQDIVTICTSICVLIPSRDILKITFKNDSDDILELSNKRPVPTDFSALTDGLEPTDSIEIKIQIDKTVSANKFSIYNFESFAQDLMEHSLVDILKWFSGLLISQEYLVFEVFDSDISFSTGTMAFVSNENAVFSPKVERIQRLRVCKETACFYNMSTFEIIPEDFVIDGIKQNDDCFRSLFEKLATILSLVYTASTASITDTDLTIQINGQRATTYSFGLNTIDKNLKWLTIYSWIYTDGNSADKALIAHNVISLHCKYADLLSIDDKVYDSIKSNYNLYLRNNVVHYLDLKKDISKFIRDVVAHVGDYTTSIASKFRTNLIAIFGLLLTVVLTKVGATQNWDNIFSQDVFYLFELVFIGSLGYMISCYFEARYKLKKTVQSYDALKENYKDILSDAEIQEAFGADKLLKATEKSARNGIKRGALIWCVLLVLIIIFIEFATPNKGVLSWFVHNFLM